MIIYLVRHGEYKPGEGASHFEDIALGLTPLGKKQAEAVARLLARRGIKVIYSSELARAKETAEIIAVRCGVPLYVDARFNEFVATLHERDRAKIKEIKRRARGDFDFASADGESLNRAVARFEAALANIAQSKVKAAAIISHEMIMQYALIKMFSLAERPNLHTASVTAMALEGSKWRLLGIDRTVWSLPVFWGKLRKRRWGGLRLTILFLP